MDTFISITVASIRHPIRLSAFLVPPSGPSDYIRSPYDDPETTTDDNNSFFACVRDTNNELQSSFNQDTLLFLRGNAQGKPGIIDKTPLTILQRGVISRSVIDATVSE